MRWISTLAIAAVTLAGCAGAGGPIYEFRPTDAPLSYRIRDHAAMRVETPVGDQTATDSTHATVAIEIAGESNGHRDVRVSFAALEFWSGGDFPKQHVVGDELIGQSFNGQLSPGGVISVTEWNVHSRAARQTTARITPVAAALGTVVRGGAGRRIHHSSTPPTVRGKSSVHMTGLGTLVGTA